MKRDYSLIRELLLSMENQSTLEKQYGLEQYDKEVLNYHRIMVFEAGLISGVKTVCGNVIPFRLTWAGHEFISNAKNEAVWRKALSISGEHSFSVLSETLNELAKDKIGLA